MKSIRKKYIIIIFLFATFYFSCNSPVTYKDKKHMRMEIIPSDQISISWEDSTIYQHNTNWHSYLNNAAYDSLADLFKNSKILIKDMWVPNEEMHCKIPYTPGMEVIVKLSKPDTLIFKYGFEKNNGGFLISCFEFWRHYKYTYD